MFTAFVVAYFKFSLVCLFVLAVIAMYEMHMNPICLASVATTSIPADRMAFPVHW